MHTCILTHVHACINTHAHIHTCIHTCKTKYIIDMHTLRHFIHTCIYKLHTHITLTYYIYINNHTHAHTYMHTYTASLASALPTARSALPSARTALNYALEEDCDPLIRTDSHVVESHAAVIGSVKSVPLISAIKKPTPVSRVSFCDAM